MTSREENLDRLTQKYKPTQVEIDTAKQILKNALYDIKRKTNIELVYWECGSDPEVFDAEILGYYYSGYIEQIENIFNGNVDSNDPSKYVE